MSGYEGATAHPSFEMGSSAMWLFQGSCLPVHTDPQVLRSRYVSRYWESTVDGDIRMGVLRLRFWD